MSLKNVLVGALAIGIAFAALDLGTAAASAAPMAKPHHHHVLVCKSGYVAHKVKVNGKWAWHCHRVHHHKHHHRHHHASTPKMPMNPAPKTKTPPKTK